MDNSNEKKLTNHFDALYDSTGVTASQVEWQIFRIGTVRCAEGL